MNPREPSSRHSPPPGDDAVEQAAADWIARLDRGLSPAEAAEFALWETASPAHAAELARLKATWLSLDTADEVPKIMQIAHEVERMPSAQSRPWWRKTSMLAALGAAAAITVAASLLWRTATPDLLAAQAEIGSYKVVPSDAQRVLLVDGTIVKLKEGSRVEPAFSATERRVRLVNGEAYFKVSPDAGRPFIVLVGDVAVRAVGTAFNIRFDPKQVEVLVTEGKVRVDDHVHGRSMLGGSAPKYRDEESTAHALRNPAELLTSTSAPAPDEFPVLAAGHRVVIDTVARAPITPEAVTPADLERVLTWQGTQLVFERTPLGEAIAAFNSFNRLQLVLGEPALAARRLGGTFRADSVDAFVRLLETGFEISAERRGNDEIVLRSSR